MKNVRKGRNREKARSDCEGLREWGDYTGRIRGDRERKRARARKRISGERLTRKGKQKWGKYRKEIAI